MNILIVGCRKVGSRLASTLSAEGHTVSVVDRDPRSFDALDNDFDGYTISGIPIDEDVLKNAGIEVCDAIAAVTPDDNINIMVCQIAKELFHVPIVLTRIYDPVRQEIFASFGISTVCSTNLTVNAVKSALVTNTDCINQTMGSSTVNYFTAPVPKGLIGKTLDSIENDPDMLLFAVMHENRSLALAANGKYVLQASDKLVYAQIID